MLNLRSSITSPLALWCFWLAGSVLSAAPSPVDFHRLIDRSPVQEFDQEINCYGLPYGGIGFLSHVLTFYSIGCIGMGVTPLPPWKRLSRSGFNVILAVCSLLGSTINAIIVMVRCRREWQFLLLAIWKFGLSSAMGCIGIHRAYLVAEEVDENDVETHPFVSLIAYAIGLVIGFAGLFSLVHENWYLWDVKLVTIAIWATAGGLTPIIAVSLGFVEREVEFGVAALVWAIVGFSSIFGAFYCDWVLAVITGNLLGAPSTDVRVIYWVYFAAKRLPLLFQ